MRIKVAVQVMDNFGGIVVHDHWKPDDTMTGVLHALCNAHHLRSEPTLPATRN